MGKYLSSENGEKPMTCHRTSANDWELFEMIWSNDNDERTLSLKGNNGKFVSIGNGNEPMWCKSGEIGDTEKFHYHPLYKFSNEIIG
uniref:Uncharacterized protein n=1 Tax=Panagrolaimus superbus TaxID=310955 RepID=A0A914Y796_9BILA